LHVRRVVGLELIEEIDQLWEPVYPYLARHIMELYGRREGAVLEIGPFCGVIFSLIKEGVGSRFVIASFPSGMGTFFLEQAEKSGVKDKIEVTETDACLGNVGDESVDLAIFRGAFFFPELFDADLGAISRVLKPAGLAFVGGGFGKYTPNSVILSLGRRSRELNLEIGKKEISEQAIRQHVVGSRLAAHAEVMDEGGLWVVIRK
jgi:ubiquinone/menaquinone biosynthesis C-methylase UbiE